jgi:hypothetical protein
MSKFRTILAVLLALFAILTLLDRFVLVELLVRRIGIPLLVAAATALAMLPFGALLRRAKHVDVPLDLVIGYPILGAVLFLVGALKVNVWTMSIVFALGALGGLGLLLKRYSDDAYASLRYPPLDWSAFAVLAVLACAFVEAQAPPASLDELTYHLAVPHTWTLEGRAIELPLNSHSYFPLGIESVDLIPLTLLGGTSGGIASHFLHLFAAISATLLIARRTQSWLATAAVVTTPALAITAGWSLVDWPLAGHFAALWMALEDDDRDTASAATAAGLLTKYTFAPFALVAWAIKLRIPRWQVVAGIVFFARNLILTGNPFAPFFGSDAPAVSHYRELALADYVFEGAFVDEAIGASILTLPVFATGTLAIASAVLAIALFFLAPSSRILVPFLVAPAMSAAGVLKRRTIAVFIAIAIVVQTFLVLWFTGRGGAFALLSGTADEAGYVRAHRASFATIEWLNATLPKNARLLVVGESETYWFARPVRGGGNFDGPRVSRYLDVPTPEALHARLREDGITHVALITIPPTTREERKKQERQTNLSPAAQRMLAQVLDRYAANMTTRGTAVLFALR